MSKLAAVVCVFSVCRVMPILETRTCHWRDENACQQHAATLARQWQALAAPPAARLAGTPNDHAPRLLIELDGTLGAGKTTWVRHLLRALGVQGTIKSPSYTVVETYDTAAGPVAHFDFYRFQDPHEWEDAGLRDVYGEPGIKVAEWPEKAQGLLPEPDLRLRIRTPALPGESADAPGTEAGREVTLEARTALGQRLLA
jgi:tRNA threonylcarbamoyladenosine biosynthesis protein TsaE